jgi:hypothetical protein
MAWMLDRLLLWSRFLQLFTDVFLPPLPSEPGQITKEAGQEEEGDLLFTSHKISFSGGAAKRM